MKKLTWRCRTWIIPLKQCVVDPNWLQCGSGYSFLSQCADPDPGQRLYIHKKFKFDMKNTLKVVNSSKNLPTKVQKPFWKNISRYFHFPCSWIRIRISNTDSDPGQTNMQIYADPDPQHCFKLKHIVHLWNYSTCHPLWRCWSIKLILTGEFELSSKHNQELLSIFTMSCVVQRSCLLLVLRSLLPGGVLQQLGVNFVSRQLYVPAHQDQHVSKIAVGNWSDFIRYELNRWYGKIKSKIPTN
jgi:hypothetical protein